MKKSMLSLALMACVPFLYYGASAYAGEHNGNIQVFSTGGHQHGGWLGVSIQDITPKLEKKKNLKDNNGAYVSDVLDDSPADSAGVKAGDVIVEFNGKAIDDAGELLHIVQKTKPGTKTTVVVLRDSEKKSLAISVGKPPHERHAEAFAFAPPMARRMNIFGMEKTWGLQLSELNEQLGEYFGAPNGRGLLVEAVDKKSAGAKAGFKAGDVITKVNKNTVEELRDLSDALEDVDTGDKVDVQVIRKGAPTTLTVEIEDNDAPSSFNFRFENAPGMEGFGPEGIQLRVPRPDIMPDMRNLELQIDRMRDTMSRVKV
ncbi:MAG TPA: PDZ domain-containing protein [Bacteroidota bacterium]|nr:PDZ domain-containing protein [Bacteroidota bacterium]